MILDCPEAVDELLTDLYDGDSFLASPEYLGAFERYGDTVERMGSAVTAGSLCFVSTNPPCSVSSGSPLCGGGL